ncbi:MAG TPA: CvpA family protein [Candidatus Eisenbacteria bacterium]|jgi:uncharacterized membrane protein required for colicin V production
MTWLDWGILVLILVFAIHGFLRGTVAQVFVVLGLLFGAWAGGWVWHWLAAHWRGAEPALAFLALRWVVAGLGGLAVAALIQWWGDRLGAVVKSGPAGWLDRGAGFAVGATLGAVVTALVLMTALALKPARELGDTVARTRVVVPLMRGGAEACSLGGRFLPGSTWLRRGFLKAEKRARAARNKRVQS